MEGWAGLYKNGANPIQKNTDYHSDIVQQNICSKKYGDDMNSQIPPYSRDDSEFSIKKPVTEGLRG